MKWCEAMRPASRLLRSPGGTRGCALASRPTPGSTRATNTHRATDRLDHEILANLAGPRAGDAVDADRPQRLCIGRVEHAFGEGLDRQAVQHGDDALEVVDPPVVARDPLHGARVELDIVDAGFEQALDARQSFTHVFESHPRADRTQLVGQLLHLRELLDRGD